MQIQKEVMSSESAFSTEEAIFFFRKEKKHEYKETFSSKENEEDTSKHWQTGFLKSLEIHFFKNLEVH